MWRLWALTSLTGWLLLCSGPMNSLLAQEAGKPAEPAAAAAAVVAAPSHLAGTYDTGSIAWLMTSAALVFFMMPGLALFYGGMCRSKNVLNMFMCVMVCIPIVAIQWVAVGYNLAFAVPSAIAVISGGGFLRPAVFQDRSWNGVQCRQPRRAGRKISVVT